VKLLLDEMYGPVIAEQLRVRGHDAVSIHEESHRRLEGAPDVEVFELARAEGRLLVTENAADFPRIEAAALARGEQHAGIIYTTNRQFPRGEPAAIGRLVRALDALTRAQAVPESASVFLQPAE